MNRTGWANGAAFAAALGLTALAAWDPARTPAPALRSLAASPTGRVPLPAGGFGLRDASGQVVPLRPYRRIVSTSMMTDRLLVELAEPDRILAFSTAGARSSPWAYQLAGRATVDGLGALEPLIALRPDLILMNRFGEHGRVAKLRAAGIEVFDLGELRGVSSLLAAAEAVGELLGHPDRGLRFARAFERRMRAVSAPLGDRPRHTALYVAVIGPGIYGGTAGTSYHDVLTAAGLVDVAAARFRGWPAYSAEQLVAMAPDLIVTKTGMGEALCAYPGLDRLRVCREPGRIIELPAGLIDEPGPAMLDAAEALFESAYGR